MDFLKAMRMRQHFVADLKVLRERQRPAEYRGEQACCRSGHCCWRRPCDLGPGDPEKIAAHLGITPQEFFRLYLVVDTLPEGGMALRPRRAGQTGGRMIDAGETYDLDTPCVFLDEKHDNACTVHDVKPVGGLTFKCWEPGTGETPEWTREALLALGWDGVNPDW